MHSGCTPLRTPSASEPRNWPVHVTVPKELVCVFGEEYLFNPPLVYHGIQHAETARCWSYERRGDWWDNPVTRRELFDLDRKGCPLDQLDVQRKMVHCMPPGLVPMTAAALASTQHERRPLPKPRRRTRCLMQYGNLSKGHFVREVVFDAFVPSPVHCWETRDGEYITLPECAIHHLSLFELRMLGI